MARPNCDAVRYPLPKSRRAPGPLPGPRGIRAPRPPRRETPMQEGLFKFERTHLERLKLACDVLLELAADDQLSDGLEVELCGFKEQVERELLHPTARQRRRRDDYGRGWGSSPPRRLRVTAISPRKRLAQLRGTSPRKRPAQLRGASPRKRRLRRWHRVASADCDRSGSLRQVSWAAASRFALLASSHGRAPR